MSGYATRTANCWSLFERDLPLLSSNFRPLILRDFCMVTLLFFSIFLPSCPYERSLVWRGWMTSLVRLFRMVTHPLRGWGMVDESRTETANRL